MAIIDELRRQYKGYADDEIIAGLKATKYADYSEDEIAAAIGYKPSLMARAQRGLGSTTNAARIGVSGQDDVAKLVAEEQRNQLPATAEQQKMRDDIAPAQKEFEDSEGWGSVMPAAKLAAKRLAQFVTNPREFAGMMVENLPNSLPGLAGSVAGGVAGGVAGPAGSLAGSLVGGTAGGYLIEQGAALREQIVKEAHARGVDPKDAAALEPIVAEKYAEFLDKARLKGIGTAGTDAVLTRLTLGLAGAGEKAIAKEAGALGASAKAGTVGAEEGMAQLAALEARNAARNTLGAKVKRGAGITGMEMAGEGASEAAGQALAYGKVDALDVVDESLMGLGQGVAMGAAEKTARKALGLKETSTADQALQAADASLQAMQEIGAAQTVDEALDAFGRATAPAAAGTETIAVRTQAARTALADPLMRDALKAQYGDQAADDAMQKLAVASRPDAPLALRQRAISDVEALIAGRAAAEALPTGDVTEMLPVGEATELEQIPTPDTRELDMGEAAQLATQSRRFKSPAEIAAEGNAAIAAETGIPAGEATEIDGETVEAAPALDYPAREPRGTLRTAELDPAGRNAVAQEIERLRGTNTLAARAYVREYEAGRITDADVMARLVPNQPETAQQRIEAAARQAPGQPTGLIVPEGARDVGRTNPQDDAGGAGAAGLPEQPGPSGTGGGNSGGSGAVAGPAPGADGGVQDGADSAGAGASPALDAAPAKTYTDLMTGDGKPYGTRAGAAIRAKKEGGQVIEVDGGWIVRTGTGGPTYTVSQEPFNGGGIVNTLVDAQIGGAKKDWGDDGGLEALKATGHIDAKGNLTPKGQGLLTRINSREARDEKTPEELAGEIEAAIGLRQVKTEQGGAKPADAPAPTGDPMMDNPASWVIREKGTGRVFMETFDKKKVDALNTERYEAVPIAQHLRELNKKPAEATKPEPLYASRPVTNAQAIRDWAASQGFKAALPAEDLHVTVAYSRKPLSSDAVGQAEPSLTVEGGTRTVEPLGDGGAIVLKFSSRPMMNRWRQYREAGASWDHPTYTPHITLTYDGAGIDLAKVEPYTGPIELGAETQESLNLDKKDEYTEEPVTAAQSRPEESGQEPADVPTSTAPRSINAQGKQGVKHPRTVMGSRLLAEVSKQLNGLDPAWIEEFSFKVETAARDKNGELRLDKKGRARTMWRNPMIPGIGKLFREGGTQDLILLAEVLEGEGYLEPGAVDADSKEAGERAKQMVRDALSRTEALTQDEQQDEAQAAQDADRDAYYAELDAESAAEAEAEREAIMAELELQPEQLDDLADDWAVPGVEDKAATMRALGFTEQEIADEIGQEASQAPEGAGSATRGVPEEPAADAAPAEAGSTAQGSEPEGLKRDPEALPEGVRRRLTDAIRALEDIRDELANVMAARGAGVTLHQALVDRLPEIRKKRETLDEFRKHAERNGFNAEAIIDKLGGDTTLETYVVNGKTTSPGLPAEERLLLMPCCDGKLDKAAPAGELYQGVMWQTLRAHQPAGGMPNMLILSAKHGLIDPAATIEPYDERMTAERVPELRAEIADNVASLAGRLKGKTFNDVLIVGGSDYRTVMADAVAELLASGIVRAGATVNNTAGMIGEQRQKLGEYLRAVPGAAQTAEAAPAEIKFGDRVRAPVNGVMSVGRVLSVKNGAVRVQPDSLTPAFTALLKDVELLPDEPAATASWGTRTLDAPTAKAEETFTVPSTQIPKGGTYSKKYVVPALRMRLRELDGGGWNVWLDVSINGFTALSGGPIARDLAKERFADRAAAMAGALDGVQSLLDGERGENPLTGKPFNHTKIDRDDIAAVQAWVDKERAKLNRGKKKAPADGLDLQGGEFNGRQWLRGAKNVIGTDHHLMHGGKLFITVKHAGHPTAIRPYYLSGPGTEGADMEIANRKYSTLEEAKAGAEQLLDTELAGKKVPLADPPKFADYKGDRLAYTKDSILWALQPGRYGGSLTLQRLNMMRDDPEAFGKTPPEAETKKALDELVAEGRIEKQNRSYRLTEKQPDAVEPEGLVVMPAEEADFAQAMRQAADTGDIEADSAAGDQARGERERELATFRPSIPPVSLPKVTSSKPKIPELPFITPAAAAKKLDSWKDEAARQGDELASKNAVRTVISLFDASGVLAQPWVDAGYNVVAYDLQTGADISEFNAENMLEQHGNDEIWAILAQPPCTDFASSGAQWWKDKDADGRTEASNELVRQVLRTVELFRPPVWVMENPVGRISRLNQLPEPLLSFDPWHFGDDYTKRTLLWGNFNNQLPMAPVNPTQGSKMHKLSSSAKYERSLTPEGFAYAFFMANNAASMPDGIRLSREFPGIDAADFDAALAAGTTEQEIRDEIADAYYDSDLDYVRAKLDDFADKTPGRAEKDRDDADAEDKAIAEGRKILDGLSPDKLKEAARRLGIQTKSTGMRKTFIGTKLIDDPQTVLATLKDLAGKESTRPERSPEQDAIVQLRKQESVLEKLLSCLSK